MTNPAQSNRQRIKLAVKAWDRALTWTLAKLSDENASAQDIAQAMKFLAQNGIDRNMVEGTDNSGSSHDLRDPDEALKDDTVY